MAPGCELYLKRLCQDIQQRPVGSEGNRQATSFFQKVVEDFGWEVESTPFQALDWQDGGAEFRIGENAFQVYPSPYSEGCSLEASLITAGSLEELEKADAARNLLLLHGDLAREQLMPKNFVFYNPEEHQRIIELLEQKQPGAILAATSRNAALAGGVYPFPLIEDGDFQIPSVYLTEEEGQKLLALAGEMGSLTSQARRIPAVGYNLIARKGQNNRERIAISAHIDAKMNTPGAIDNATGVIVLMLLAERLKDYRGEITIELLPFNGEDYYAAPGQMIYLEQNQNRFNEILININIDGAGFHEGPSAFSSFNLEVREQKSLEAVLATAEDIIIGGPWYQGDHSIFLQQAVPAIAVTSRWFLEHIDSQEVTHTPRDNPSIVNIDKLVDISETIYKFIYGTYLL